MSAKYRLRVADRVEDIRVAIANIRSDLGNLSKDAFLADGKTQRAVIESLIVIGEAATQIIRTAPELETTGAAAWQHLRDANGMRNILTHEYFRVDASVVWDTINNDLSDLEASLLDIEGYGS